MKSIDTMADELAAEARAISARYQCSMAVAIDEVFYNHPEYPLALLYLVMERTFDGVLYD